MDFDIGVTFDNFLDIFDMLDSEVCDFEVIKAVVVGDKG
jgi:hypothetical protein